jgi:hypothetical protein
MKRELLFCPGDCVFLLLVGSATTVVMRLVHGAVSNMVLAWLAGMALAMVAQIALAICVAPVLGSLESMVPSMVVAMAAPMSVCLLDWTGYLPSTGVAAGLGAGAGLAVFFWVRLEARKARNASRSGLDAG